MTSTSIFEYATAINMQSADNWESLDEMQNTPAVSSTDSSSPFLNTNISYNQIIPVAPQPDRNGPYGYLNGTQSVATNQLVNSNMNCGDFFCSGELGNLPTITTQPTSQTNSASNTTTPTNGSTSQ